MEEAFAFGDKSNESAVKRINEIRHIAIIGAGTMGQGIVTDLLRKTDYTITILDIQREALNRARDRLAAQRTADVAQQRIRAEDAKAFEE